MKFDVQKGKGLWNVTTLHSVGTFLRERRNHTKAVEGKM